MRALRIPMVVAVLTMAASSAQAADTWAVLKDKSIHDTRPQTLDLNLILGFYGVSAHYGVAGWYGYPIVPNGFIPAINDALYIEGGAAIERYSNSSAFFYGNCDFSSWALTPLVGGRYQVYLTKDWTVFVLAKLGYTIASDQSCTINYIGGSIRESYNFSGVAWDTGAGAYWKFSDNWALRLELGYFGMQVGAGMQL